MSLLFRCTAPGRLWEHSRDAVLFAREACGFQRVCQNGETWSDAEEGACHAASRPDTKKAYVLLRDRATSSDVLRGAFHAHLLLHRLDTAKAAPSTEAANLPTETASGPAVSQPCAEFHTRPSDPAEFFAASATADMVDRGAYNTAAEQPAANSLKARQTKGMTEGMTSRQRHQLGSDGKIGVDMLRSIRVQADAACAEYLAACAGLGWDLGQTMLNPHEPRLVDYVL